MNPSDQHAREHLSAGVDGELAHEELRFLLRRLDHDGELRRTWVSYHVARDVLRKQLPPLAEGGFVARVMLAIEQETAVSVTAPKHRWLRWSAGGVIAASVAAAALMVSQPAGDIHSAHGELTAQATSRSQGMAVAPQASDVAVVPAWLSGKAPGLLSEKASATLGAPPANVQFNTRLPPPYGSMQTFGGSRYRTLDNHDGSYLILLDPAHQPVPSVPRQSAAGGR